MKVSYSFQWISQISVGNDEKPIINLNMSIKVRFLFSINWLCNIVLGAYNWDIILYFYGKNQNY